MIYGCTVNESGELVQRLPVRVKLAIGLPPKGSKNYPERLDHFLFLRRGGEDGSEWVPDTELMKHYAPRCTHEVGDECEHCCRSVNIMLLDDDLDNVFPSELAWWSKTEKKCWGDGIAATRRTQEHPEGQKWERCRQAGCPDWDVKCKASGDLRFVLADYPMLGSVARLHTSSERSIQNIFAALVQAKTIAGRLAFLTLPLRVTMEKSSFINPKGERQATIVPILSIESSFVALQESAKKTAEMFTAARKAFGPARIEPIEDDEERPAEISQEFPGKEQAQLNPAPEAKAEPEPQQETVKPAEPPKAEPVYTKTTVEGEVSAVASKSYERVINGAKVKQNVWMITLGEGDGTQKIFLSEALYDAVMPVIETSRKPALRPVVIECEIREQNGKKSLAAIGAALKAEPMAQASSEEGDAEAYMLLS